MQWCHLICVRYSWSSAMQCRTEGRDPVHVIPYSLTRCSRPLLLVMRHTHLQQVCLAWGLQSPWATVGSLTGTVPHKLRGGPEDHAVYLLHKYAATLRQLHKLGMFLRSERSDCIDTLE